MGLDCLEISTGYGTHIYLNSLSKLMRYEKLNVNVSQISQAIIHLRYSQILQGFLHVRVMTMEITMGG